VITNTPNNFGGQVLAVLQGSSKALIATLKVILIGIIAILPFVIVFGAVAAVILFIVRYRRKRKNKTDAK
jgi:heme/copper-type cytochrome/quinol oxidase subunit 2